MFYEKLAEAKRDKKRSKMRDRLLTGAGTVAGGVGGYKAIDPFARDFVLKREVENFNNAAMDTITVALNRLAGEIDGDGVLEETERITDTHLKMNRRAELQGKGIRGAAALLGAGALGYGTKKLLDRYNARRQRED